MTDKPSTIRKDPFTERTYRERRALLGASTVAIAFAYLGVRADVILPRAVDVPLTDAQQETLVWVVFAVIGYLLVMFLVYGILDYLRWKAELDEVDSRLEGEKQAITEVAALFSGRGGTPDRLHEVKEIGGLGQSANAQDQVFVQQIVEAKEIHARSEALKRAKQSPWFRASSSALWIRLGFDGAVPLGLALWALIELWGWQSPC